MKARSPSEGRVDERLYDPQRIHPLQMEANYGQSSTPMSANAFITPAKHRVSFGSASSSRSHGNQHEDSGRRISTPSSASSSRSLMHSGRSVRSVIATIPEKASPINATPSEFKRVKITPQRMDSPGGIDYDSKLKQLTDPKRIKVPSPEEKQQALSAMTHMFDEDELDGIQAPSTGQRSPIVTPLPTKEGNSNPASSGASSVSTFAQKQAVDRKDHPGHSSQDNYAVMFSDSSFLEDTPEVESNTTHQPVPHEPLEADNPWINMLNAAVDAIQLNQPQRPPPVIPQQYHPRSPFISSRQAAETNNQPSFSSLVATLAQNHEKSVVYTPHTQASLKLSSSSRQDSFQASETKPLSRVLNPSIDTPSVLRVPRTPTNPKDQSATVSQTIPEISLPVWTPTKSVELDKSLQPYLDFLGDLDREFFSVSNASSSRSGDDVQRLWQRYMLLPVDDLQKQVFEQHQALADLGVFNQILSLEPDATTANSMHDSRSGRTDLTPVK